MTTLVWLRKDLRLADNPALLAACRAGAVVPVFILDEAGEGCPRPLGGASRWWLAGSLAALAAGLAEKGSRLILRRGHPAAVLGELAATVKATAVHWNRRYDAAGAARDEAVAAALGARGLEVATFNAGLLAEPWEIATGSGRPYQVFKPFWVALRDRIGSVAADGAPEAMAAPERWPASDALDAWGLLPTRPDWAGGLRAAWTPGEAAAKDRLEAFLADAVETYPDRRDLPAVEGTARLSPHLHWGEIGPRQVWAAVASRAGGGRAGAAAEAFLRQVAWREFCCHLLHHFPRMPAANLRSQFDAMAWSDDPASLSAWQRGETGYPIVDAGMRQLWQTGWMHNRVRMIAASFLIKHLLVDWRHGERWFWDTLVDADYAQNGTNWQWVAGTGVDSNMFVRIMAPLSQSEKFDAAAYIRQYVPELCALDEPYIHDPAGHGCRVKDYPQPLIAHRDGRERALAAYRVMKGE